MTAVAAPPPRRRARSLGEAFSTFCSSNFRHHKGHAAGSAFVLEPWQRRDNDLILELEPNGRRRSRNILYGLSRGNGKSPIASAHGLVGLASLQDRPEIYIGAPTRDGAGIVHDFARHFVTGGRLRDFMTTGRAATSPILCPRTGGVMRVLAGDGDAQHGLAPSVAILDELHAFRTRKQEELYFALSSATQKRRDAIEMTITTAGFDLQTLLGERYSAALEAWVVDVDEDGYRIVARHAESRSLMIWRGAPADADPHDPAVWRKANPASWIPDEELAIQAGKLPLDVFRRLILNQWTESDAAVLSAADWDACRSEERVGRGMPAWLAIRIDETREQAALVIVCEANGRPLVRAVTWEGEDAAVLPGLVEAAALEWASVLKPRCVVYDPWQARETADRLRDAGLPLYRGAKSQQPGMPWTDAWRVPASQLVFDLVKSGRLAHDGDLALRRHVLACTSASAARDGWYLAAPPARRDGSTKPILAAQALAMALIARDEGAGRRGKAWASAW